MSIAFDEVDLIRSVCQDSYYEFVKEFWDVVVKEPFVPNWHIELMCDELQDIAERVFAGEPKEYDLLTNISPGTTKSIAHSVMLCPWTWTRMPRARHIHVSHTEGLVHTLSLLSRDIVRSEKYRACWPHIEMRSDQDTKSHWKNTLGGERFCSTVGGKTPTGLHAHIIVIDDPIDPKKALSDIELKAATDWMDSTLPSRKVDKMLTPTILVMQRLAQTDPSGHMLAAKGKVRHLCLPAELTEDVKPAYLKSRYVDGLMDPRRLPWDYLHEEAARGTYYYAGQYLQNPVPKGGGMFKVLRMKKMKAPDMKDFKTLVRYWDKAGTAGGGAWTVGVLMGLDREGRIWILDVIRVQLDSAERETLIKNTAQQDGKKVIVGVEEEGGSGGKESADGTAKRLRGYRVVKNKPTKGSGSKIIRADPLSSQVNAGNCYYVDAPWNEVYLDEMKHFPYSKFKDQIDASAGAFTVVTTKSGRATAY